MKSMKLTKMKKGIGFIPHPASLHDNPMGLCLIGQLFNVDPFSIIATDIGIVDGESYNPVDEDDIEDNGIDVNDLSFVIFCE